MLFVKKVVMYCLMIFSEINGLETLIMLTVNIALYKPTYQRHPYSKNDARSDASNAVDGYKSDLSVFGDECVESASDEQIAIWSVDLTSIQSIHHIIVYFRTRNSDSGTKTFRNLMLKNVLRFCNDGKFYKYISNSS